MTDHKPAKRPFGSHVSRVLGSAGFERAESETTSIRGHYRYSPGFRVLGRNESWEDGLLDAAERDAGYVTVQCQTIDSFSFDKPKRPHAEVLAEKIPAYLTALESAGYAVEDRTSSRGRYLVVLGRD